MKTLANFLEHNIRFYEPLDRKLKDKKTRSVYHSQSEMDDILDRINNPDVSLMPTAIGGDIGQKRQYGSKCDTPEEVLCLHLDGSYFSDLRKKDPTDAQRYNIKLLSKISDSGKPDVLYRIIKVKDFKKYIGQIQKGTEWEDNTLCSTSSDIKGTYEFLEYWPKSMPFVLLCIHPQSTIKYVDVNKYIKKDKNLRIRFSMYAHQREYILLPTTKYKITNVEEDTPPGMPQVKFICDVEVTQK